MLTVRILMVVTDAIAVQGFMEMVDHVFLEVAPTLSARRIKSVSRPQRSTVSVWKALF